MNLEQIQAWAREAGEIGLRSYNNVEARTKHGGDFVTDADEAIERLLRERIRAAYPDHGILGEEGRNFHTDHEYLWALDPIDGTGVFVAGLPMWGVSIGLLQHGHPIMGCFYLPVLNDWYAADRSGPALFNGSPIEVQRHDLLDQNAWIGASSDLHRHYEIDYPGKVRSLGSTAAEICYVARGSAIGAIVGRPKLWDIAASMAILERAGGELRLLKSGAPLDPRRMLNGESAPEPVIAGSPEGLEMLRQRVRVRS